MRGHSGFEHHAGRGLRTVVPEVELVDDGAPRHPARANVIRATMTRSGAAPSVSGVKIREAMLLVGLRSAPFCPSSKMVA